MARTVLAFVLPAGVELVALVVFGRGLARSWRGPREGRSPVGRRR